MGILKAAGAIILAILAVVACIAFYFIWVALVYGFVVFLAVALVYYVIRACWAPKQNSKS